MGVRCCVAERSLPHQCLVHRPRPARAVFARLLADEPASSGALPAAPVPVLPLGEDAQAMASAQLVLSRSDASSRGAGPECSSGRCSEPASASRGGGTRDSARSARSSGSSISNVSALAVGDTLGDAGHHGASLTEQVHSRAEARAVVFMLRARLSTLRSTLPPADDPAAAQSAGAAHAMAGRRAGCEAPAATLSLSDWQQLQQRAKQAVAQGSRAEGASEAAFFASLVAGQRSCAPVDLAALQLCAAGDSGGSSSAQAPCALPTSASVPSRPVPPRPRSTRGGRAAVTVGQPNTTSTVAAAESAAIKIAAPAPASAPVATIATRQLPIAAARLASPPTAAPAPAPAPASVAKPPAVRAKAPTPAIASVAAAPALPASPATPSALSAGAARVASAQRLGHVAAAATESTADNASDADEEDEAAFYRRLVSASARPAPAATRKLRTTSVEQRLVGLDSETDSERDGGAPDADCDLGLSLSDGELAPASPPPAVHRHVKVKVTGAAKADTASRPRRQGRQ